MVLQDPVVFPSGGDLDTLPQCPAVYILWPRQGDPYLAHTNLLRRRMRRVFGKWNLGETLDRIEYWPAASKLELWLVSLELAQRYFPDGYERLLRLPKPAYVRLILNNRFPRTMITTRVTRGQSLFFGPFPTRAAADQFDSQFLDLFQLRRCQEDLLPSPGHPGCIYGEMNMCMRPCQEAVTDEEYYSEATRVSDFLILHGASMLESTASQRDRCSGEMLFEEAARQHARYEKIEQILKIPGELAREVKQLNGVVVTKSTEAQAVELWFLHQGCWLSPRRFSLSPEQTRPLDARLRELTATLDKPDPKHRHDHLALLAKWYFSSWRDGEWLAFDQIEKLSYRKLVNAIHRIAQSP